MTVPPPPGMVPALFADRDDRTSSSRDGAPRSPGGGSAYLMVGGALLGFAIGYGVDRIRESSPKWTIGLGLAGIALGLYHTIREASR